MLQLAGVNFKRVVFALPLMLCLPLNHALAAGGGSNEFTLGAGNLQFASKASSIAIAPGYHRFLKDWIQVGGDVSFTRLKYETTTNLMIQFFAGATINIGAIPTAFFFSAGVAFRTGSVSVDSANGTASSTATAATATTTSTAATTTDTTATDDPSGFGFGFFIGKRFPIAGALHFRPTVGVVQAGTMGFVLNLMNISYTF